MTLPYPWVDTYRRVKLNSVGFTPMNGNNLSSYTFSGVALLGKGLYAFVVSAQATGSAGILSSLTVGGVAANIVAETNPAGRTSVSAIAYLRVDTTDPVALAVAFSSQQGCCSIAIYKISGNKSDVPLDKQSAYSTGVTTRNISLNVPRGAVAVFGAETYNGSNAVTISWTGADYGVNVQNASESVAGYAAISNSQILNPARSVTATATKSGVMSLSGVSWR